MRYTFIATANQTTNGVSLGVAGQDVYVKKLQYGTPLVNGVTRIYDKATAYNADTANIAFRNTQPASFAAGTGAVREVNFVSGNCRGLLLDGGNIQTTANEDLCVLWAPVDEDEE